MTTESDVYRTANVVIDKYGDDAALYSAIRGDEFHRVGNHEGEILWRRVTMAVQMIQSVERPEDAVVH